MAQLTMQVEDLREVARAAVVSFTGEIDTETIILFQNHLATLKSENRSRFILDMGGVRYINSTGFGCLINFFDTIKNGEIVLARVQQKVRVVLDMLGLNNYFKMFPTRDEALRYMKSEPEPIRADDSTVIFTKRDSKDIVSAAAKSPVAPKPASAAPPVAPAPSVVSAPAHSGHRSDNEIECRYCHSTLIVSGAGAYKCPRCLSIFSFIGRGIANFLPKRKVNPVQLGLALTSESTEGLLGFVRLLSQRVGFKNGMTEKICLSVKELVGAVKSYAYSDADGSRYHVLIVPADGEMEIQISDYGKPIIAGGRLKETLFPATCEAFDRFDIKQNTGGGNLIVLMKRV